MKVWPHGDAIYTDVRCEYIQFIKVPHKGVERRYLLLLLRVVGKNVAVLNMGAPEVQSVVPGGVGKCIGEMAFCRDGRCCFGEREGEHRPCIIGGTFRAATAAGEGQAAPYPDGKACDEHAACRCQSPELPPGAGRFRRCLLCLFDEVIPDIRDGVKQLLFPVQAHRATPFSVK